MPIFFLIVGILLMIVAINDKMMELGALVKEDFAPKSGPSFTSWVVAVFVIGALGYSKTFKPVANAFLVLIVIVMIISNGNPNNPNGGLFSKFTQALKQG